MKKFLLGLVVLSLFSANVFATQEDEMNGLIEVMKKATMTSSILIGSNYTVARTVFDRLQKKGTYTENRILYAGNKYKIIGIGCEGILDLDVKVLDSNGNVVASDTKVDNFPEATFIPTSTGTYTINVIAYNTTDASAFNYNFFCCILAFQ